MKLTAKQEKFATLVASGKNQTDAYREAYPASLNWAPGSLWSRASNLMRNGKVLARIEELRAEVQALALWTKEQSIEELKRALSMAEKSTDVVAAIKELNAMHGFNAPQKHELTGKDGADLFAEFARRVMDTPLPLSDDE